MRSSFFSTDSSNRLGRRGGLRLRAASLVGAGLLGLVAARAEAMQLTPTPAQKQEMREHYDRASRAYDIGKFSDAIEEYQKVYEIGGNVAMLYNIAQSYRLNNQLPEALRYYRRYLERSPNASNRDDVEKKIADLEKATGEHPSPVAPAGTAATPAASPPPAAAPPAAMAPPPYVAAAPAAGPPPGPAPGSAGAAAASGGPRQPWLAYSLMAVGAGGLILAIVEGSIASDKADKIGDQSRQGQPFDPSVQSNGQRADTIAITAGVIGAAALATGGVMFFLNRSHQRAREASHLSEGSVTPVVAPVIGSGFVGAGAAWAY